MHCRQNDSSLQQKGILSCFLMKTSLTLLRFLRQSTSHKLIRVQPLVHCGFDARRLRAIQRVGRPGGDTFFVGSVGQIIDNLLYKKLLLQDHGSLLQFLHARAAAG